ncbi:gas vesicle protein [Calderihabitans maritimus]|uniref:Uncharacterized protein n=1 Tax=Calderihabitans maritimus TaxID=1246530 RepID=A0A1Z5HWT5_9FIRM|nr:gas vesicle protein [Calderihabitans maritimus]GAW93974.1 hypothetical protein KKC1_30940 [Calderihabitans maritimus]
MQEPSSQKKITLLETIDRVLDKGVVIAGDITISVADVDLIYLGLRLLLSSVETINTLKQDEPERYREVSSS